MKARLYINKENLKYNIEYIKSKIGKERDIIAMLKANAYGAGDKQIALLLKEYGINFFGVANIDEAIRLRNYGIDSNIIVTSPCIGDEIKAAIENDISMSVSDINNLIQIQFIANSMKKIARVHIKAETGMTRLGFTYYELKNNLDKILSFKNISIEGIYSHLSCAGSDEEYTKLQFNEFKKAYNLLKDKILFKYVHILNSDGIQNYAKKDIGINYTHVRVGLMLYGYTKNTKPILKLEVPILHINDVKKYQKVGYDGTFIAKPNMKIAVLKIGYADGISRSLSNNMYVVIRGKKCPIVGNICMDMCMVDVTDIEDINIEDKAIFFDYTNDLKELAKKSNKIVYEFISNLSGRIERIIE